ncbi:hypothetical protein F2Q70_00041974 [Brassica cretica]|uniref:Uncharacterized protein n=1 Tax=Brassica cretica TaxID=69181 RepID=A0A8S9K8D5_BRACR|nr:hypothetical protein F2Q70_00041974 [Brassica cretica]
MMVTLRLVRIYPGWNPKLGFGLDSDPTDYPNRYRMAIVKGVEEMGMVSEAGELQKKLRQWKLLREV